MDKEKLDKKDIPYNNKEDYILKCKKYADNFYKSAVAFKKAKNMSAATEYLSRSLSLNPDNADAYLLLAEIEEHNGDNLDALKNYKAYVGYTKVQPNAKKIDKKIEEEYQ